MERKLRDFTVAMNKFMADYDKSGTAPRFDLKVRPRVKKVKVVLKPPKDKKPVPKPSFYRVKTGALPEKEIHDKRSEDKEIRSIVQEELKKLSVKTKKISINLRPFVKTEELPSPKEQHEQPLEEEEKPSEEEPAKIPTR